jgi:methyl-accepting chemotaxis protein
LQEKLLSLNLINKFSESSSDLLNFVSNEVTSDYEEFMSVGKQYSEDSEYVDRLMTDFSATTEELLSSIHSMTEVISEVAKASNDGAIETTQNAESAINIKMHSNEVSDLIKKSKENTINLEKEVKKFCI